ncbi:hypothetical protein JMA_41140 (plasmid) [Jeotgalibacillus malaysiensis]|uniref:Uncharacterized protein n=1 Tax=Jeotgalibacillus malaysiensis TaxID=1508404 RepID=A0A0B5ATL3_9BACL|nr:sialidase family protein [Jeotgalibacillus malaysiensis]AJD93431.1 hypothetical protein JMA_41140 [Jeotgalibacillus malaysiensis]
MKKKQMMLATATVPMLATGLVLPMGNESVVQKVQAEGTNEVQNQADVYKDGESLWQDKYNPWHMAFTGLNKEFQLVDTYYDGQKMVEDVRQSKTGVPFKKLKTESGKIFAYGLKQDALEGVFNQETGLVEKFPSAEKHPFGFLNTLYYSNPTTNLSRYNAINQMAEINGVLIATTGNPGSSTQYYSISRDNGETWENISDQMKSLGYFEKITLTDGKLTAQRVAGGKTIVSESTDGLTWSDKYAISSPYIGFDIYETESRIVAFINSTVYISENGGSTFSQQALPTGAAKPVFMNGKFVTFVQDDILYSEDGKTWKKATEPALDVRKIYADPIGKRFIALSKGYVSVSEDADTWTSLDMNLSFEPTGIVFDDELRQNKTLENKKTIVTANDSLPLGKKAWETDISQYLFRYTARPLQFPMEMKENHTLLGNYQDFFLRSGGKLIHGYLNNSGLQVWKENDNPSLNYYTNTRSNVHTGSLRMTSGTLVGTDKILTTFKESYQGVTNGIAIFDKEDLLEDNSVMKEVLPVEVQPLPVALGASPTLSFSGDGFMAVTAVRTSNNKTYTQAFISKDEGKTWEASNEVEGRVADVVVTEDGKIVLFGDTQWASGQPFISVSEDGGKTFENVTDIQTIGKTFEHTNRSGKHDVAYRDGVYIWNNVKPYRSTDLVNWTPIVATGSIDGSPNKNDVKYDPVKDAFILIGQNYIGLSKDGEKWRELLVHNHKLFENGGSSKYAYSLLNLTITSDYLSDIEIPKHDWQNKTPDVPEVKDESAPTASVSIGSDDWTNRHATIEVSGIEDEGEGFDYMVLPDGTISKEQGISFIVTENGSYSFKLYDKAGNMQEYIMDVKTIDKTPARVEVTPSTADWTKNGVSLSVTASDTQSGISYIELPNGEKVEAEKAEYEVSQNGEYTFKAVDKAGNELEYRYEVNNIDNTPATAVVESDITSPTKEDVVLSIKASDEESGVASITLPSGEIVEGDMAEVKATENGVYTFIVKDKAGNESTFTHEVKNIDREPGETTLTNLTSGWTNEFSAIEVQASDKGSGVDYIVTPDGDKVEADKFVFEASDNGVYTFTTVDKAGNEWTESISVTNIDRTVGTAKVTPSTTKSTNAKFGVTLSIEAKDAQSGVEFIILPNGVVISGDTANYHVHANGEYTFVVLDRAGNAWTVTQEVNNLKGNAYRAKQDPTGEVIYLPNGKVWKGKAPTPPKGLIGR